MPVTIEDKRSATEVMFMLKLDKNDPLDRMIIQELQGEPVLFDTWLDAMDELDEEPDCAQILQARGLRAVDVLRDAENYRADFLARLSALDLSIDDCFTLCTGLVEQAQNGSSPQLLRVYCEILADPGFLLETSPEYSCEEDRTDHEEQVIMQYLNFCPQRDTILKTMTQQKELSIKFSQVKKIRNPRPADCDTKRSYEIAKCFAELFELPSKGNRDILLGNLSYYIQIVASSSELKAIEPLLVFRLLTRHRSRMCTVRDLNVRLSSLWERGESNIDHDNGKNFKQYRRNLHLFQNLCRIYSTDKMVDLPLCWYVLDQITVLGDFTRQEPSLVEELMTSSVSKYGFPPTVGELVEDALFSCFENGYGDNVVLENSGLSCKELMKFECSPLPQISRTLNRISDYMNDHADDLIKKFLQASPGDIGALCQDILESANRKSTYQPKDTHELALFLSSINGGLMELQDYLAQQYLILAGNQLTQL